MTIMGKKKHGQKRRRLIVLVLSTILLKDQSAQLCGVIGLTVAPRGLCPCHSLRRKAVQNSFRVVLGLGFKETELCPLAVIKQKESRIPLQTFQWKLRLYHFCTQSRFISRRECRIFTVVETCVEVLYRCFPEFLPGLPSCLPFKLSFYSCFSCLLCLSIIIQ